MLSTKPSTPYEYAERDHIRDPKPLLECLDNYIEFKVLAMLYVFELHMPTCNPHEGCDYWGRRVELMIQIEGGRR